MAADLQLSNDGIKFAGGNIVDLRATMPSSGSWVAGDVILESTPQGRVSGWKRATTGTGNVLGIDWIYFSAGLTLSATQSTTSATSFDFTGIPSYAKRLTLGFSGVSTNGTSQTIVQLGKSAGLETSGYNSYGIQQITNGSGLASFTSGFAAAAATGSTSAGTRYGQMVITLLDAATNTWTMQGQWTNVGDAIILQASGVKSLAGTLDRLRLVTVNGTDAFDGGSISLLVE